MIAFVRAVLFYALFFGWTALLTFMMLPTLLLSRERVRWVPTVWIGGIQWMLRTVVGLTFVVRGRERVPAQPVLYAAKHQSAWETLALPLILPGMVFVLKKELLAIPLYGWYLRHHGMVAVDRAGGATALRRMLRDAKEALAAGRPVLIFPEGTRTAPGERRPYHPGVAALYRDLGVPVVPIALNSGLYWARRSFLKRPGCIVVEFLEPIAPGATRQAFVAELQARIEAATATLVAEAGGQPAPKEQNKNILLDHPPQHT